MFIGSDFRAIANYCVINTLFVFFEGQVIKAKLNYMVSMNIESKLKDFVMLQICLLQTLTD